MQKGFVLWFTGLKGSNMVDVAECVEGSLLETGQDVEFLNDELMKDDFGEELPDDERGREILIARAIKIGAMLSRNGVPTIIAMDAPKAAQRQLLRREVETVVEVYCKCSNDSELDPPDKPEVIVDACEDEETACRKIQQTLSILGYLSGDGESDYSSDEEAEIKKRLKDLGYL